MGTIVFGCLNRRGLLQMCSLNRHDLQLTRKEDLRRDPPAQLHRKLQHTPWHRLAILSGLRISHLLSERPQCLWRRQRPLRLQRLQCPLHQVDLLSAAEQCPDCMLQRTRRQSPTACHSREQMLMALLSVSMQLLLLVGQGLPALVGDWAAEAERNL